MHSTFHGLQTFRILIRNCGSPKSNRYIAHRYTTRIKQSSNFLTMNRNSILSKNHSKNNKLNKKLPVTHENRNSCNKAAFKLQLILSRQI